MNELKAGRELDALIATRVMGWRWLTTVDRDACILISPETAAMVSAENRDRVFDVAPYKQLGRGPANYSTNIAEAWKIVETLWDCGWNLDVSLYAAHHAEGFKNGERMYRCAGECRMRRDTAVIEWAKSAPLAICLAALKAVGDTV